MAKYTTQLKSICYYAAGITDEYTDPDIDDICFSHEVQRSIFRFYFPIFDENYRDTLQAKILKHYYNMEIGEETVNLWRQRLNTRLNEIMPYYNKLYESELIDFNPMLNMNYTREGWKTGENSDRMDSNRVYGGKDVTTGSGSETGSSDDTTTRLNESGTWDLYSDTPQGGIQGIQAAEGVSGNGYLTNARHTYGDGEPDLTQTYSNSQRNTSNTSETDYGKTDTYNQNGSGNNREDYLERFTGLNGMTGSKALQELRETFLNIDMMIIEELSDLFMGLW